MAKLTLTIDSDDFDYIAKELNIEVDVTQDKILEIINKNFNLEETISKQIRRNFLQEVSDVKGQYRYLMPEVCELIRKQMKPIIETQVGNYIRTEHHTAQQIVDEEVKKHIEIGIRNGIVAYAEKISKKLAESLNV